jgi:hypothetical protein
MQELPEVFGELQSLLEFNAGGCSSLSRLPESFGQLPNLERLDLHHCVKLQSLPTSFGGLTKLKVLNISYSRLQELPEDFGELQSLVNFHAGDCSSLSRLLVSFGQLPNLHDYDDLQSLPTSFGGLTKLKVKHIGLWSGRTSGGFWGTTKSCKLPCWWLFLFVGITGIIWSVAKLAKIEPPSLCQISKPTYIFWWTDEVESFKYIVLRNARTSGGFWGTTKSRRLRC